MQQNPNGSVGTWAFFGEGGVGVRPGIMLHACKASSCRVLTEAVDPDECVIPCRCMRVCL